MSVNIKIYLLTTTYQILLGTIYTVPYLHSEVNVPVTGLFDKYKLEAWISDSHVQGSSKFKNFGFFTYYNRVQTTNQAELTCKWIPRCREHTDARKCASAWRKASGDVGFIDGITSLPPHSTAPRDGSDGGSRSLPERFLLSRQELDLYRTENYSF